jgi:hypothetical protein
MNTMGSNPWVGKWLWYENSPGFGGFGWNWSDKAPAIFTQMEYPGGGIRFDKGIVTDIQVKAALSPAFLVLLAGQPERYGVISTTGGIEMPHGLVLTFVMPERKFWFTSVIYCPFYPHVWSDKDATFIHWGNIDDGYTASWNNLTAEDFMNQIQSEQSMCR